MTTNEYHGWGSNLKPEKDVAIKAAWGARAIKEGAGFALVFNRKTPAGDIDGLVRWLDKEALKQAKKTVGNDEASSYTIHAIDSEKKHLRFSCYGSYGYVYLFAWEEV